MIYFMRVDACPRCRRGFSDDPGSDAKAAECLVCCGRPVRVLVLGTPGPYPAIPRALVAGEAALAAVDLIDCTDAACGPIVEPAASVLRRAITFYADRRPFDVHLAERHGEKGFCGCTEITFALEAILRGEVPPPGAAIARQRDRNRRTPPASGDSTPPQ